MLLPDGLNILMVFWRGDGEEEKRPRFVGHSGYFQRDAVRRFVKRIHVAHKPVVADVPFTHFMANYRGGGRNCRVISNTLWKIVRKVNLSAESSCPNRKDQSKREFLH